jgi:hypothetical protein
VETVDNGDKVEVRVCLHRPWASVSYVVNDPGYPPVLAIEGCTELTIVSLTNQVIRASCPFCFNEIRKAATISMLVPENLRIEQ